MESPFFFLASEIAYTKKISAFEKISCKKVEYLVYQKIMLYNSFSLGLLHK